jgi:hypothetical protein
MLQNIFRVDESISGAGGIFVLTQPNEKQCLFLGAQRQLKEKMIRTQAHNAHPHHQPHIPLL